MSLSTGFVDVTVVIVTWNSATCLRACIDSLINQTDKPAAIVVVDNNSQDDSVSIAAQYGEHVTLVCLSENTGFATANMIAIEAHCKTSYVALLNPDARAHPNWVGSLIHFAEEHPELSFFGSTQLMDSDHMRLDGCGDAYHVSGIAWRRGFQQVRASFVARSRFFSPCGAGAMYRTEHLRSVGGFDRDYFCYYEDVDLAYRMRLAGMDGALVESAHITHIGSASSGGRYSDTAIYYGHRNMVWTFFKNTPLPLLLLFLLPHLCCNLVFIAVYGARDRMRLIARAKWDGIRALPTIFQKRKYVQRARKVSSAVLLQSLSWRGLLERR